MLFGAAVLLVIGASARLSRGGDGDASAHYVQFYEHPNGGGRSVKMPVGNHGEAIPCDEFEKWNLQDQITSIDVCLPEGATLILYTDRFFRDGTLWRPSPSDGPGVGVELSSYPMPPLRLKGTGKVYRVDLRDYICVPAVHESYDDHVRSARVVNER
jgi:hypothetical protein